MKATELIKKLEELIEEHGNLDVTVYDEYRCGQYSLDISYQDINDLGFNIKASFEISQGYRYQPA